MTIAYTVVTQISTKVMFQEEVAYGTELLNRTAVLQFQIRVAYKNLVDIVRFFSNVLMNLVIIWLKRIFLV